MNAGMALVSVFLMSGTMSTYHIVASQARFWWAFALFPAFIVYCISACCEVNRLPFDMQRGQGSSAARTGVVCSADRAVRPCPCFQQISANCRLQLQKPRLPPVKRMLKKP